MPIYELDGVKPELPEADTFWIAPDAHVIWRVRLGREVGVWFGGAIQT
jgi:carbonic anhydrase/acetyltransferase-like protein (isoleucine patch superfamily)